MTDSVTSEVQLPQDKPPAWANSLMRRAVTTPGIQGWVGQGVALLSFKGRRTGKSYTIPVSYHRDEGMVTVVTKRVRNWWHNYETPTEVGLRLAGHDFIGTAVATSGDESLEFMLDYLGKRPIDAKAYGLGRDEITREKVTRILPHIVVIRIAINPAE